jgi:hypothetical protein
MGRENVAGESRDDTSHCEACRGLFLKRVNPHDGRDCRQKKIKPRLEDAGFRTKLPSMEVDKYQIINASNNV